MCAGLEDRQHRDPRKRDCCVQSGDRPAGHPDRRPPGGHRTTARGRRGPRRRRTRRSGRRLRPSRRRAQRPNRHDTPPRRSRSQRPPARPLSCPGRTKTTSHRQCATAALGRSGGRLPASPVGRVAFMVDDQPWVLPVNIATAGAGPVQPHPEGPHRRPRSLPGNLPAVSRPTRPPFPNCPNNPNSVDAVRRRPYRRLHGADPAGYLRTVRWRITAVRCRPRTAAW